MLLAGASVAALAASMVSAAPLPLIDNTDSAHNASASNSVTTPLTYSNTKTVSGAAAAATTTIGTDAVYQVAAGDSLAGSTAIANLTNSSVLSVALAASANATTGAANAKAVYDNTGILQDASGADTVTATLVNSGALTISLSATAVGVTAANANASLGPEHLRRLSERPRRQRGRRHGAGEHRHGQQRHAFDHGFIRRFGERGRRRRRGLYVRADLSGRHQVRDGVRELHQRGFGAAQ
jgi:hypothetical protein